LVDLRRFSDYLPLMPAPARLDRYRGGIPVYRYVLEPHTPPVQVLRFEHEDPHPRDRAHIHDFPALLYVTRDEEPPPADRAPAAPGTEQGWRAGDLYLVAPGNVVQAPVSTFRRTGATAVFFAPEAVSHEGSRAASWRSHPLLFPFLHGTPTGLLRLRVPAAERPEWSRTIGALETELAQRRNEFILGLASKICFAYTSLGGHLEKLLQTAIQIGKPIIRLDAE